MTTAMMMMTMTVVMTIMMTVAVTTMTSGCPAREGDDNGNDVDDLTQVALPGRVEERLLALEGDKDQLHMQVIVIMIRNVLGTKNLGDILSERESIAKDMQVKKIRYGTQNITEQIF